MLRELRFGIFYASDANKLLSFVMLLGRGRASRFRAIECAGQSL
jgi:hypothetical protein